MSVYDRAYAACKANNTPAGCQATIKVGDDDWASVKDIADPEKKRDTLRHQAAAGCKGGCGCTNAVAEFTTDESGREVIVVSANDVSQLLP